MTDDSQPPRFPLLFVVVLGLGLAGLAYTLRDLRRSLTDMEGQHWVMLVIVLAVGYVAGRVWTAPAKLVGLP